MRLTCAQVCINADTALIVYRGGGELKRIYVRQSAYCDKTALDIQARPIGKNSHHTAWGRFKTINCSVCAHIYSFRLKSAHQIANGLSIFIRKQLRLLFNNRNARSKRTEA